MLQRALAMSMDGGAPDLAAMTEEEQIAYAMRMSMADSQAEASQVRRIRNHTCQLIWNNEDDATWFQYFSPKTTIVSPQMIFSTPASVCTRFCLSPLSCTYLTLLTAIFP
jgi:hypothetical protein